MSRIDDLIADLCPEGVPFRAIGEIGELVRGNGMPRSDFVEAGVGCIHYGQIYMHYGTWTTETKSFVTAENAAKLATALDEPTLRAIAERTDGRYVEAADAPALAGVADAIDLEWKVQTEHVEVTALLAAAAGLLVLAAAVLSLAWNGRVM